MLSDFQRNLVTTTRVWEVKTGQETVRFNTGDRNAASFSGDPGKYLVITGGYSEAYAETQIWLWQPQDLLKETCNRLTIDNLTEDEWEQYSSREEFQRYITNTPRAVVCSKPSGKEVNLNK
jgi:hypothetical protein